MPPPRSDRYGGPHRAQRKREQAKIDAGRGKCWRCGRPIPAGSTNWHLGHTPDGLRWAGIECIPCNLRDGGKRGYRAMIARATDEAADARSSARPEVPPRWSRHWAGPFNPEQCPECRRLGRGCPEADR